MSKLPHGITEEAVHDIGVLAAKMVTLAIESGVAWDHAVTALGMSAKSLAAGMPWENSPVQRTDHAQKAFNIGFNQQVRLAFVDGKGNLIDLGSASDAKTKLSVPGIEARIVFD
jgi:hypothetical protein